MTLKYLRRITQVDRIHMMSVVDHVTICVEIPMIDSEYSLENEFIEIIHMNSLMVLYLTVNEIY